MSTKLPLLNFDFGVAADPTRRHDFVLLFDCMDGNPNGDPDSNNMPRQDQETEHGIVTDVCIKRKVRNFVSMFGGDETPNRIYVQDRGVYLNDLHAEAHKAVGIAPKDAKKPTVPKRNEAREWMCNNFYDVRMFGAVMSLDVNCGQVRGPVQLTFARSVDPITPVDVAITRVALANEKEQKESDKNEKAVRDEEVEAEDEPAETETRYGRTGTMGRKSLIHYGLYVAHGFVSAPFAQQTKVTEDDLRLLWTALCRAWDVDHSASRGLMSCRGLYVFTHDDMLGNEPAHRLFATVQAKANKDVAVPRRFEDYMVSTPTPKEVPDGVTLTVVCSGV